MQLTEFKRICHKCNSEIFYSSKASYTKAIKKNTKCKKCKDVGNKISDKDIEKILSLNNDNVPNAEIARLVGISYNSVRKHLDSNNRKSYFINNTIDMVSETEAKCTNCKLIKKINKFSIMHSDSKYECRASVCNDCRKTRQYDLLNNDINKYLSYRFRSLKRSAAERNINFSLSKKEFIDQYNKQNGLCFYTDLEMICKIGQKHENRNVLSIDRVDINKGYIPKNIVFTTYRINSIKNDLTLDELKEWIPGWFARIDKFLLEN